MRIIVVTRWINRYKQEYINAGNIECIYSEETSKFLDG